MGRTWKPTTAGILSIIAGSLTIFEIIMAGATTKYEGLTIWYWWWRNMAPLMLIGVVAILGGIFALYRRIWGLSLAGIICSVVFSLFVTIQSYLTSIGIIFGIIAVISILALIFLLRAKNEFALDKDSNR